MDNHSTTRPADHAGISSALDLYIRGAREGKSSLMAPAFHPEATVRGHIGERTFDLSLAEFLGWVDNNPPAADLIATIALIEAGTGAAIARVECSHWLGVRYTDFFTLLRRESEWKIVSKVFDGDSEA